MIQKKASMVLTILLAILACGCVSVQQPPSEQFLGEKKVSEKNYVLQRSAEAVVGTDIIRVKDYSVSRIATNQVEVISDFQINGAVFSKKFSTGEIYPYAGTTQYDGRTFNLMKVDSRAVMFDDDGAVFHKVVNGLDPIGIYGAQPVVMIYTFDAEPPGPHLKRITSERADTRAVGQNYEIIFTGITSDSIRMSYREYSPDDLAKPAFAQDLTYPIKSKEIRFRNLVIKITEVTQDHITYTVTSE
jgi:hypothetical protein